MATKQNRLFIASLKAAPEPCGIMTVPADHPDAIIVAAWNKRQEALAALEARSSFFDAEDHSPKEMDLFDTLENGIPLLPALTPHGLIAKLWIAMAHCGSVICSEQARAEADAIRRADFDEVLTFADRMDFDEQVIFQAIRDLTDWLRFEQVFPMQRAA